MNGCLWIMSILGDVTVTATRRQIVSFSNSIFDNSLRIIMRKSHGDSVDLLSYLRTSSTGVWLMLLATCLVAATLMCILERHKKTKLYRTDQLYLGVEQFQLISSDGTNFRTAPTVLLRGTELFEWCSGAVQTDQLLSGIFLNSFSAQNFHRTVTPLVVSLATMGMWYSLGVIVGYGVDFHVRTAGLYIISLVFVATYTANLASYLTLTKTKDIISGIDDVKAGKIPFNRIGVRLGTSVEAYYLRVISNAVKNYYPLTSRPQEYQSLLDDLIDASFMDIGVAEYATNNIYCNLTLIGASVETSAFGIVIPKDCIYAQDLDVNILALRESGQLDALRVKWFQAKTCQDDNNGPAAMGIESLGGLFLLFAVISILSILLFLWKNRFIIKNYAFNLFRGTTISVRQPVSTVTNSIESSNDSPVCELDPVCPDHV